jgi:hypothetical protein
MKNKSFGMLSNDVANSQYDQTLMRIALSTRFDSRYTPEIMRVVNATPNPHLAVAMLLGEYQEPAIPVSILHTKEKAFGNSSTNRCNLTFVSFNAFTNEVEYTYNGEKTTEAWVLKSEKDLHPSERTVVSKNRWSDDAALEAGISHNDFRDLYSYETIEREWDYDKLLTAHCDLEKWLELHEWFDEQLVLHTD